jgi:hypothetical protein
VETRLERLRSRTLQRLDFRYVTRNHEMEADEGASCRVSLCESAQILLVHRMRRDCDGSARLDIRAHGMPVE